MVTKEVNVHPVANQRLKVITLLLRSWQLLLFKTHFLFDAFCLVLINYLGNLYGKIYLKILDNKTKGVNYVRQTIIND